MEKKHYGAVDGLRMIAASGIAMMHIRANNNYEISGFIFNTMIPSFTNFVFLFMTVSAFGMCCGYYEKIINNKLSLSDFYGKRFKKVSPFFGVLVLLDIVMSPSVASMYEGFADLTLLFGFLPGAGNISVIGVGWFLGLIFVFYLVFPFFCVLLENKRRAWEAFTISLIYNFACTNYFQVGRTNILYSACFFLAGGLIYLYRDELEQFSKKYWWVALGEIVVCVVLYYAVGSNTVTMLLVSAALLIYALGNRGGVLQNKFSKFFSSISMEVYLSHMVMFRVIEKLQINTMFGDGWLQYVITVVLTICGAAVFSVIVKNELEMAEGIVRQKMIER